MDHKRIIARATLATCLVTPLVKVNLRATTSGKEDIGSYYEKLVEPDGIEPTTSSMPLKRSPN